MTSNKVYSRCCMPSKVHLSANKHSILHLLSCMVLSNDIVHTTCSPAMVFCVCCHKMIVGILLQWRNIHISQCPVWFSTCSQLFYCGCQIVLKHSWVLLLHVHAFIQVLVIAAYLISSGFMSVYHMAVDTIFICASEFNLNVPCMTSMMKLCMNH